MRRSSIRRMAIIDRKHARRFRSNARYPRKPRFARAIAHQIDRFRRDRAAAQNLKIVAVVERPHRILRRHVGPRADEPPPPPAERLGRCFELDPVIRLAFFPIPSGGRVLQPHAPRFLAEMGLVADRADPLAGRGVRPDERAVTRASGTKELVSEEFRHSVVGRPPLRPLP